MWVSVGMLCGFEDDSIFLIVLFYPHLCRIKIVSLESPTSFSVH